MERTCPKCNKLLVYKSAKRFRKAVKNNGVCRVCGILNATHNRVEQEFSRKCNHCSRLVYHKSAKSKYEAERINRKCKNCKNDERKAFHFSRRRICRICGIEGEAGLFRLGTVKNDTFRKRRTNTCIECSNQRRREQAKKWRDANPESESTRHRMMHLKQRYDMTSEEFENMLKAQGNKCAICKISLLKKPHIDHDHTTGKVREILCIRCNFGLGYFQDNIAFLNSAVSYLHKHQE